MGTVTQFPGKSKKAKPTPTSPKKEKLPKMEVVTTLDVYNDLSLSWLILKKIVNSVSPQRRRATLTLDQQELFAAADKLPAMPGQRKED